ncbi:kinase [Cytobacillus sp. FJAT-53684]|uniref:Kinase n=1 Tax=Cytobacillus mangrovibacter TaxID=3299024 RepID=A0ABW6K0F1_9BACI
MAANEITKSILFQYSGRTNKNRPFLVAIDGLSGAGKTTLIKRIESEIRSNEYKVMIIHIDDHIVKRNKRYDTGHEEWYEYYYLQWDVDMLVSHLFKTLHNNSLELVLPYYNHSTDSFTTKQTPILSDAIVLIEGIFLQRKEWQSFYDYIIFLDCPREIRYKRVLERDSYIGDYQARLDKYKRRYWPGEDHYMKEEKPIENADVVIDI